MSFLSPTLPVRVMNFSKEEIEICSHFQTGDVLRGCERLENGKIHDSFRIFGNKRDYVLQRINTRVCPNIISMMQNWHLVTAHILSRGGIAPELIPSSRGYYWDDSEHQSLWRMMVYIPSSVHFSETPDADIAYEAGHLLGEFHYYVSDLDISVLDSSFRDFHHPGNYYRRFCEAFEKSPGEIKKNRILEHLYPLYREREARLKAAQNTMSNFCQSFFPCHYDPKLSNMLFHETTRKGICLIDLDTLAPGVMAYDFADAVRSVCSYERKHFLPPFFEAFFSGYVSGSSCFFPEEFLPAFWEGVCLIPLELSLRYAEDYLRGGRYFSTLTPDALLKHAESLEAFTREVESAKENSLRLMQRLYKKC